LKVGGEGREQKEDGIFCLLDDAKLNSSFKASIVLDQKDVLSFRSEILPTQNEWNLLLFW